MNFEITKPSIHAGFKASFNRRQPTKLKGSDSIRALFLACYLRAL